MSDDAELDDESDATVRDADDQPDTGSLVDKRVWFVGKLGGFTRREAQQLVRQRSGTSSDVFDATVNLIVLGAEELLWQDDDVIPAAAREAAALGKVEIVSETQLWQRLGLVESEQSVRSLYTPAMLADLLQVPIATIRRWHRRGLIIPAREVHRLPYFSFDEIATARRLVQLLEAGVSPASIERKLAEIANYVPNVERPLAQLSIIVEGRQLLLRKDAGLVEANGQIRIDFDALENQAAGVRVRQPDVVPFPPAPASDSDAPLTPEQILEQVAVAEESGDLELAIDLCRTAMAAGGPRAESAFLLGELLYRVGDLSAARERYYQAIEMDEDYVEARANLGCLLLEQQQSELAIAAFTGALRYHPDYPDAHYHLARTLDDCGRTVEAEEHWREFLRLAPDSPWAEEARQRLTTPD
ncbi:MAG: tetratricopeptide repeat protein [Planctomycetota bacterium]